MPSAIYVISRVAYMLFLKKGRLALENLETFCIFKPLNKNRIITQP